jgi:hypothetical protein
VAIWRWITLALGVLAATAGLVVTGIVVLVGHSGSEAVWLA